jgi:hypothetical protein
MTFLTRFLQCILKLLDFFGELRKVVVYKITFSSTLLSGAEIRFLLSVLFKPMCVCVILTSSRGELPSDAVPTAR